VAATGRVGAHPGDVVEKVDGTVCAGVGRLKIRAHFK
jgi:hypothetical protein